MHHGTRVIPQQMQHLIGSSICRRKETHYAMDWQPFDTAPFGEDLQLGVIEDGEVHSLAFPCRRTENGWSSGRTDETVPIHPTHWRHWDEIL
jgi:hypothetical protein